MLWPLPFSALKAIAPRRAITPPPKAPPMDLPPPPSSAPANAPKPPRARFCLPPAALPGLVQYIPEHAA
ncbi:MAG: hypothetical protein R6W88_03870 [Desulfobacterales bacterium]